MDFDNKETLNDTRNTTISVRVNHSVKSEFIDFAGNLGMNQSEAFEYLIAKADRLQRDKSKFDDIANECKELKKQFDDKNKMITDLQNEIEHFKKVMNPIFSTLKNKLLTFDKKQIEIKSEYDVLEIMVKCFKLEK